jgi:hypothetical protein
MDRWSLVAFSDTSFQPALKHSQLIPLIELSNRLLNGAESAHVIEQLLDVRLVTLQINQRAQNHRSRIRIHLEDVDLDVFVEAVLIQVSSKFIDVAIHVTEEDEWSRISKSLLFEEIFDEFRLIAFSSFGDDSFKLLDLVALGCCFNVLVVYGFLVGGVDQRAKE